MSPWLRLFNLLLFQLQHVWKCSLYGFDTECTSAVSWCILRRNAVRCVRLVNVLLLIQWSVFCRLKNPPHLFVSFVFSKCWRVCFNKHTNGKVVNFLWRSSSQKLRSICKIMPIGIVLTPWVRASEFRTFLEKKTWSFLAHWEASMPPAVFFFNRSLSLFGSIWYTRSLA